MSSYRSRSVWIRPPQEYNTSFSKLGDIRSDTNSDILPRLEKCIRLPKTHNIVLDGPVIVHLLKPIGADTFEDNAQQTFSRVLQTHYRPISILALMSKILEKHVYNSLYEFLSVNDLFSSKQYGFRSNHFCETALIAMDNWLNSINKNEYCGVLFINLCKAFDLVN